MIRVGRLLASTLFITLALAAAAPAATATTGAEAFAPAEALFQIPTPAPELALPDEIRGTLVFNGCVVSPTRIRMRAVPLGVQSGDRVVFPPGRAAIRMARIAATADPHVLSFSIRGLASRAPYRLGVTLPSAPCGKMFWRGPAQGLALTGARPLKIEGFAAQTQVELFSRETRGYVGADVLDFTDPAAAVRTLRWKSLIPGVTGGELQLSTEPFPHGGAFRTCDEPATGVFYRTAIPAAARGSWRTLDPIDFNALLAPPGRGGGTPIPGLTPLDATTHGLLLLGAPVYVRVVPAIAGRPACDTKQHGVAGWVVAAKRPKGDFELPGPPTASPLLVAFTGQSYAPPYLGEPAQGHPAYGEVAFRVIKPHTFPPLSPIKMTMNQFVNYALTDPMGLMLLSCNMVKPGQTLQPGTWFYYTPQVSSDDGDWFSDLMSIGGGLVTALWTGLGDFADYMAGLTEQIKTSLAKAVVNIATVVPGVSEACGGLQGVTGKSCEDVVKTGMEYGLTSMGLPPSLPNWEQLQDQGIDYLAAEVSTQIGDPTGLSQQFTDQMLHDMVDTTLNKVAAARPGLGANESWLTPYAGYDPAVWTISIFDTDPAYHPAETYVRVKVSGGLYQEVNVHVPERWPAGGVVRVPVVLQPSTAGMFAPRCRIDFFGAITCEPVWWTKTPVCQYQSANGGGTYTWTSMPCSNWPDIYYRDAWIQQKLFSNACVFLGGVSATNTGGLWLTNPNPPFTDSAYLPPLLPAAWDGGVYIDPACP